MRAPKAGVQPRRTVDPLPAGGDTQERTVDSHISKLRKKLEAQGIQGARQCLGRRLSLRGDA